MTDRLRTQNSLAICPRSFLVGNIKKRTDVISMERIVAENDFLAAMSLRSQVGALRFLF